MQKSADPWSFGIVTIGLVIIIIALSSLALNNAFGENKSEASGTECLTCSYFDENSSGTLYSGNLRILTTPDIHSHLFQMSDNDTGTRIGRIGALADTLGEDNDNTLYLFAGDLGEGGFYHMYSGVPEADVYSLAGIDAAVLGNHAFDFNGSLLKVWATNASFPILCANIDFTDDVLNETVKDYAILDLDEAKIGVFGILLPQLGEFVEIPDGVVIYENTTSIAESVVQELEDQNVDVIIALTHQYEDEDVELAESVSGIDLVIGGHDHLVWNRTVTAPDGRSTLIVHAGKYGEETDSVVLVFEKGEVTGTSIERYEITEDLPDDESITSFVMPYYENYTAGLSDPIGKTLVPLDATYKTIRTGESNAGDLITDAIRMNVPGVDIALLNSGSIRGDCIIPAGEISYLTLETLLPFENMIVTVQMTGDEVKDTLERSASAIVFPGEEEGNVTRLSSGGFLQVSGIRFDINPLGESFSEDFDTGSVISTGNRIENLMVVTADGIVPIDPDTIYTVAVNDYLAGGGNDYTNIGAISDDKKVDAEVNVIYLLAGDIEENSPISPECDGRIRVLG